MAWKERPRVDARVLLVSEYLKGELPMTELCQRFGTSRKTVQTAEKLLSPPPLNRSAANRYMLDALDDEGLAQHQTSNALSVAERDGKEVRDNMVLVAAKPSFGLGWMLPSLIDFSGALGNYGDAQLHSQTAAAHLKQFYFHDSDGKKVHRDDLAAGAATTRTGREAPRSPTPPEGHAHRGRREAHRVEVTSVGEHEQLAADPQRGRRHP